MTNNDCAKPSAGQAAGYDASCVCLTETAAAAEVKAELRMILPPFRVLKVEVFWFVQLDLHFNPLHFLRKLLDGCDAAFWTGLMKE